MDMIDDIADIVKIILLLTSRPCDMPVLTTGNELSVRMAIIYPICDGIVTKSVETRNEQLPSITEAIMKRGIDFLIKACTNHLDCQWLEFWRLRAMSTPPDIAVPEIV